jgi:hypothetical protein
MKAYVNYKSYWISTQAPSRVPSLYWGHKAEEAFQRHVTDLGVYKLMETLIGWEDV